MTQLNDKERAAQMADMKSFDEEMPSIGIFWYAPEDHALFGVGKKELTPKMVEEAAEKGLPIRRCRVDVWLGLLTSSLCWWGIGLSRYLMNSPS